MESSWFYPLAIIAVLVTGISKAGIGGGVGGLAVPLLALVIAPAQAAAIMLPILCLMDLFSVRAWWGRWDVAQLRALLPAAIVGIAAGAASFRALDADTLRLLLGGMSILYCANAWLRQWLQRTPARPPGPISAAVWGATAGFTSTIAHAGGPPLSMYLIPQRLERGRFVATSALFFLTINYVKLLPYAYLGLFDFSNLTRSLLLAPLAPVGIWLGLQVHRWLNDRMFYHLVHALLFLTGVKLVIDGLG